MTNQDISNIASIRFKCLKRKRHCMYPGCAVDSINSHLLQRNGVINNIVENGHVYELSKRDFFSNLSNGISFKKVGVKNAISYHLFCANHDTCLFKPIEGKVIDYDDYYSQILFTYRTVCTDIRKNEINLDFYDSLLEQSFCSNEFGSQLISCKNGCLSNIRDYSFYKEELEKELLSPTGRFDFKHYSYPRIDLFASSAFSYIVYDNYMKKVMDPQAWECCFLNIIPNKYRTDIIIGYHRDHTNPLLIDLSQRLLNLNLNQLGYELTNLFAFHVEDWGMSPSLFNRISQERKDTFINIFTQYVMCHDASIWVDFNLFEGTI